MHIKALQLPVAHRAGVYWRHNLDTGRVVDPSKRPPGIPYVPCDIGTLTWLEEQRILASLLCVVLFWELREVFLECRITSVWGEPVTLAIHNNFNVEEFWEAVLGPNCRGQIEQIATIAQWIDLRAGRREEVPRWLDHGGTSADHEYCPQYTSMTDDQ
ncbi:uncharacterized protein BDV14DRAFT_167490 [Aspergillus stella-maris]|uniref:uncharacterized protein n=1 Tax=Aspergillus stella-maris TaxID=1810926 RepID=UPI003CCD431A